MRTMRALRREARYSARCKRLLLKAVTAPAVVMVATGAAPLPHSFTNKTKKKRFEANGGMVRESLENVFLRVVNNDASGTYADESARKQKQNELDLAREMRTKGIRICIGWDAAIDRMSAEFSGNISRKTMPFGGIEEKILKILSTQITLGIAENYFSTSIASRGHQCLFD